MSFNKKKIETEINVENKSSFSLKNKKYEYKNKYPEWMSKEDINNYKNPNLIILTLVSNDNKEYLDSIRYNLFKENEEIGLNFQITERDINFRSRDNVLFRKKTAIPVSIETDDGLKKKSIILNVSVLCVIGETIKIRELLADMFIEVNARNLRMNPKQRVKNIINLDFKFTEDNFIKYMCGKELVLSATQLDLED